MTDEVTEAPEKAPAKTAKKAAPKPPKGPPFTIDNLEFTEPGTNRVRRQFTVKAISPSGSLVQLPLAPQINNQAADETGSMLGVTKFQKEGFTLLWDFDANVGAYCPLGDCWAKWDDEFSGFCCQGHKAALPARENPGLFGRGATTTATKWRKD